MPLDPDLKAYLDLMTEMQTGEIRRLGHLVEAQGSALRVIETQGAAQTAKFLAEFDSVWNRIDEIKKDAQNKVFSLEKIEAAFQASDMSIIARLNANEESQKLRWKDLVAEKKKEDEERAKKDEEVALLKQSLKTIERLLWLVITIIVGLMVTYAWNQIFVH